LQPKLLSVIIPCYNEEKRIGPTLEKLLSFLKKSKMNFEIIVVFDGTDRTAEVVRRFASSNKLAGKLRLLVFPKRLGKGGGLLKGFAAAKGDVMLMMDADSSVSPSEIPKLLKGLDGKDIAIGSRYMPDSNAEIQSVRRFFAFTFNSLVHLLFSLSYKDTQCGFKAFKAHAAKKIMPLVHTMNFVWDVDVLVNANKMGFPVTEVPIEWRAAEGGSITYWNGLLIAFKMLAALFKLRFFERE